MLRQKKSGFTLIELLVVLFIVGLMTSLATLSLRSLKPEGDKGLWGETFKRQYEQLSDQSILSQSYYGLYFEEDKITFYILIGEVWQEIAKKHTNAVEIPEGASSALYVNNQLVLLKGQEDFKVPHVIVGLGVDYTPFELQVHEDQVKHIFKVNRVGEFVYETEK